MDDRECFHIPLLPFVLSSKCEEASQRLGGQRRAAGLAGYCCCPRIKPLARASRPQDSVSLRPGRFANQFISVEVRVLPNVAPHKSVYRPHARSRRQGFGLRTGSSSVSVLVRLRRLLAPANAGKMPSDLNVDVLSGDRGTPPAAGDHPAIDFEHRSRAPRTHPQPPQEPATAPQCRHRRARIK